MKTLFECAQCKKISAYFTIYLFINYKIEKLGRPISDDLFHFLKTQILTVFGFRCQNIVTKLLSKQLHLLNGTLL